MVTRRALIGGLGGLVAGGGVIAGSGAFTGATAQRTVSVEFADDSSAYLGIDGIDGDDREYVAVEASESGAKITIDSINANARTVFDELVAFTNNSAEATESADGRAITSLEVTVDDESDNASLSATDIPDRIPAGETVTGLGLVVDTRDYAGSPEIGATISIRAVLAPEEGA
jgi:hypothetical protein